MTTQIVYPQRKWAGDDDELAPEPAPTVLVSSRDNADVPLITYAAKLARVAEQHGWAVRQTYALADVPDRFYLNGNLAKPAHQLASVAVRITRNGLHGWAVWHRVDEGSWRFVCAYIGPKRYGFKGSTSILLALASTDD